MVAALTILDNIMNFQVFQDDQHILKFIMCNVHFKGQEIDDTPDEKPKDDELEDEDGILNLKTNTIPNGMVELQCIFYCYELTLNRRMTQEKGIEECESYNLGTDEDPIMVRIGNTCNAQKREEMLKLLVEYKDVIAWSYELFKTYDPEIIMQNIPLKPGVKPFT